MSNPAEAIFFLKLPLEKAWFVRNWFCRTVGGFVSAAGLLIFLLLQLLLILPVGLLMGMVLRQFDTLQGVKGPTIILGILIYVVALCRISIRGKVLISRWIKFVGRVMTPFSILWIEVPCGQYARARRKSVDISQQAQDRSSDEWEFFELRDPGLYLIKPGIDVFFIGTHDDWQHFDPMAQ